MRFSAVAAAVGETPQNVEVTAEVSLGPDPALTGVTITLDTATAGRPHRQTAGPDSVEPAGNLAE
jgi:hypothetical protein